MLRPKHWIKNFLVFLPVLFNGSLFNTGLFLKSLAAFFSFSLVSSAIYIFNDLIDIENDRQHSVKCKRPIASGNVTIVNAVCIAAVLLTAAAAINIFAFPSDYFNWLFLLAYLVLNLS